MAGRQFASLSHCYRGPGQWNTISAFPQVWNDAQSFPSFPGRNDDPLKKEVCMYCMPCLALPLSGLPVVKISDDCGFCESLATVDYISNRSAT